MIMIYVQPWFLSSFSIQVICYSVPVLTLFLTFSSYEDFLLIDCRQTVAPGTHLQSRFFLKNLLNTILLYNEKEL